MFRTAAALLFVAVAAGCATVPTPRCAPGETRSVSELVYFGTGKRAGVVTAEEWKEFLRTSVTPRFPQGFTVWSASGQWRSADGTIVVEDSFVLNLVHPDDERNEDWVRAIAAAYKARFDQEAVLRVRSHVCVSF